MILSTVYIIKNELQRLNKVSCLTLANPITKHVNHEGLVYNRILFKE